MTMIKKKIFQEIFIQNIQKFPEDLAVSIYQYFHLAQWLSFDIKLIYASKILILDREEGREERERSM